MPARDELILDGSGDPILSTATIFTLPTSSKPSSPGIVRSPEYAANKMANARPLPSFGTALGNQNILPSVASSISQALKSAGIGQKPSGKAVVAPRFVSTAPTQKIAQVTKTEAMSRENSSIQKFLTNGLVDTTLAEGFDEMGPNFNDWVTVQSKFGLNASQLESLKAAHANHFGIAPAGVSTPLVPEKKPNYLLWAAIAVGGFFIVRRFLK